jgi:hypothetical protein
MVNTLNNAIIVFQFPAGKQISLFSKMLKLALGPTHHLIQWAPRAISAGINRQGCEADHFAPSSSKVKNVWTYTSTPTYVRVLFIPVFPGQSQFYALLKLSRCPEKFGSEHQMSQGFASHENNIFLTKHMNRNE